MLYPFALGLAVLLVSSPFLKGRAAYLHFVTFIALTGPIAFLYAPLTADFMGVEGASVTRAIAMGVVSVWRVALLIYCCTRLAGLDWIQATVACALLLTGVVTALTALNLERAVFNIMGGNDVAHTIADDSYAFLVRLTLLSIMALPVSFLGYLVVCAMSRSAR